jgi:uncharacterized membrane protein YgdD (TMEM256/DUF423 family)
MPARAWIVLGALLAGASVALGALAAHGLSDILQRQGLPDVPRRVENFKTAAHYQMTHALGLLGLGLFLLAGRRHALLQAAGWLLLGGVALFSGLLYVGAFCDFGPLVHIVPVGGVSLIVGWVLFAVGACCTRAA